MGEVKKIGKDYYIEFMARGLKYQQKAGSSQAQAQRLLEEIEAKIRQGEMDILVRDVDVDIFFRDFLEYAAAIHTPRTLRRYASLCVHFQKFLKEKYKDVQKLSGVTPRVVEDYKHDLIHQTQLHGRNLKPGVVNLSLILLKDIMEYARKLGYLNDNPTFHIGLAPNPVHRQGPRSGDSSRSRFAQDFLRKLPSLVALYKAMELTDVGKAMAYLPYLKDRGDDLFSGSAHGL